MTEKTRTAEAYKIRLATENDALELFRMNRAFNGEETDRKALEKSLRDNDREIIVVAEHGEGLCGFVCVQVMKSFCYRKAYAEITEVYVDANFRRKGVASAMLEYAETYCIREENVCAFQLLTGYSNRKAHSLYRKSGYRKTREILFRKRIETDE